MTKECSHDYIANIQSYILRTDIISPITIQQQCKYDIVSSNNTYFIDYIEYVHQILIQTKTNALILNDYLQYTSQLHMVLSHFDINNTLQDDTAINYDITVDAKYMHPNKTSMNNINDMT